MRSAPGRRRLRWRDAAVMGELEGEDDLARVLAYHGRTKHHPQRMALGPGRLEWARQPNPFRVFDGAPRIALAHPALRDEPRYDALFGPAPAVPPAPMTHAALSSLCYFSLAISAWKQAPGTVRWSLRVNPSSGDLHPTEGYIVTGPLPGVGEAPAVYHYSPRAHALERRRVLEPDLWEVLAGQLPAGGFLVALTSIYWREAWKYGERAFRYCHHDVGHAIGAVAFAAATLGWCTHLIDGLADAPLATLLGADRQQGPEAEHADCALAVYPPGGLAGSDQATLDLGGVSSRLEALPVEGEPNGLSRSHRSWPVIDEVVAATAYRGEPGPTRPTASSPTPSGSGDARPVGAEALIRQRRSAMAMDDVTSIERETFFRMLRRTLPGGFPHDVLPWPGQVALALFVHRVEGLAPGLYCLARAPGQAASLRALTREELAWGPVAEAPAGLELYRLEEADARQAAGLINCFQHDIASTSAFAAAMLARFEPALTDVGPWFYRRLFWETGLIGQVLYLEAEAAGVRATGIGCYFDDLMHELLGLNARDWQSLYHFTVGGAVDDPRLQTIPACAHLDAGATGGGDWEGLDR